MHALILHITPPRWVRAKLAALVWGPRGGWGRWGLVRLGQVEPPALPGEGWVRCRTRMGGICGSDLAVLGLRQPPQSVLAALSSTPAVPGHENVAEVVEVGPGADRGWLGRRVCVEPTLGCAARGVEPPCPRCREGLENLCEHFDGSAGRYGLPAGTSIGYNAATGGSWGEQFVAHESQLVPAPQVLEDRQLVLTDPLACSLHAVRRADLSSVQRVLVYGGGMLGLGVVACLRATGFAGGVDLLARHDFQGDAGRSLGADAVLSARGDRLEAVRERLGGRIVHAHLGGRALIGGYDAVFDCVGTPQSLSESMTMARARGQVVLLGTTGSGTIDPTPLWLNELTVLGAFGRQREGGPKRRVRTYEMVHELLTSGHLKTDGLLTHTFPLSDWQHALAAATGKGASHCIRAAFSFE